MRHLRRALRVAGIFAAAIVVALVAAVLVSQTAWFRDWLRRYAMRESAQFVDGQLLIGRVEGGLWNGVQLHDVRVDRDGETVVALETLDVDYRLLDLVREGIVIGRVEIVAPRLHLRREGDTWNVTTLFIAQTPSEPDPARSVFRVEAVALRDGVVTVDDPTCPPGTAGCLPARFEQVQADARVVSTAEALEVELHEASLSSSEPGVAVRRLVADVRMTATDLELSDLEVQTVASALTGDARVERYATTPTVQMALAARPLALTEVARFAPQVGTTRLAPAIDVRVEGPMDAMRISLEMTSEAGAARASLVADAAAPTYGAKGTASVENLDLAEVLDNPAQRTTLTGSTDFDVTGSDLQSMAGTVALEAARLEAMGYGADAVRARARLDQGVADVSMAAKAYGASLSTTGRVNYARADSGEITLALAGTVRDVDLRRLPARLGAPAVASNVALDYRASGTLEQMQVAADFRRSTIDTLVIDAGTVATVRTNGPRTAYEVNGGVRGVDLQRLGRVLRVAALDRPLYASDLNARLALSGSGVDVATAVATADVHLADSSIAGARVPDLRVNVAANRGAVEMSAKGRVENVRPDVVTGRADLAGSISGHIDLSAAVADVTAAIDPATVAARADITLDATEVGGLRIDEAHVDAQMADGVADVRSVRVVSPAVELDVKGPLALAEGGASHLTYTVDVKDAGALASLIGVPGVAGTASINGVVTGRLRQLATEGHVGIDDAVYSDTASIERLQGVFSSAVPDLDIARATAEVEANATRVDARGTLLDTVRLTTRYADRQAAFDVDVTQDDLQLGVGGQLRLEDTQQVVALRRLDARGDGLAWALAEGASPEITHVTGRLTIDGLELASGPQRFAVSGSLQLPADAAPLSVDHLEADLTQVDLAPIGARLVPERALAGRLDASVEMTGTLQDGRGSAKLLLQDGSAQGFTFSSLDASADYADGAAQLDLTLQQTPTATLTIGGRVPVLAAIGTASAGTPIDDRVDLTVATTDIDLAVLEGVTPEVADVQGRLRLNGRVTGTLAKPEIDGALLISGGAFRVPRLDAAYRGLEADVRLASDQVRVEALRLRDEAGHPFEVTGGLGIVDRSVGEVQLSATASEFRLIDNDLGDVRLTADLTVTGTPTAPIVRGEISLPESRVEVDRMLLALAGQDETTARDDVDLVYVPPVAPSTTSAPGDAAATPDPPADATAPEAVGSSDAVASPESATAPGARLLDAATIDVRLTAPNDLVLRGDDVRVADGGTSLGALNITMGADLHARQTPGEPLVVTGTIATVRGHYDFQGRRFTIVRDGAIRFEGDEVTNPTLDIAATRDISGVVARVDIQGTAQEPRLVLSSTPALDEADVLALIVFNRPLDDLGSEEQVSLARRAGELVGGRLTGSLATSLRDALDVDQFEIDAFAASGPSVTVGNRLGDRIYVRLRQQVGSQDTSQLLLEYELRKNLRLQTTMTQGGRTDRSPGQRVERSGIDLLYFFYY